jgi:hypothetical protein
MVIKDEHLESGVMGFAKYIVVVNPAKKNPTNKMVTLTRKLDMPGYERINAWREGFIHVFWGLKDSINGKPYIRVFYDFADWNVLSKLSVSTQSPFDFRYKGGGSTVIMYDQSPRTREISRFGKKVRSTKNQFCDTPFWFSKRTSAENVGAFMCSDCLFLFLRKKSERLCSICKYIGIDTNGYGGESRNYLRMINYSAPQIHKRGDENVYENAMKGIAFMLGYIFIRVLAYSKVSNEKIDDDDKPCRQ